MTTTRKASDDEITQAMMSGITFKGAKLKKATAEAKVMPCEDYPEGSGCPCR